MTKWRYFRDEIAALNDLDAKLTHWGELGWELVTVLHGSDNKKDENILGPEVFMLIFRQPVP